MTAEAAMRTISILTCATTLSLFTTIVAYAAINAAPLRWDGSFCGARDCATALAHAGRPARI